VSAGNLRKRGRTRRESLSLSTWQEWARPRRPRRRPQLAARAATRARIRPTLGTR
jgi:hypothetical protein